MTNLPSRTMSVEEVKERAQDMVVLQATKEWKTLVEMLRDDMGAIGSSLLSEQYPDPMMEANRVATLRGGYEAYRRVTSLPDVLIDLYEQYRRTEEERSEEEMAPTMRRRPPDNL